MAEYGSAEDYQRMQAKLKDIDKKVARIYRKRLREAAPPLGRHVLEYGIEKMPKRGGLQAYLKGNSPISTSARPSGVDLWLGSKKKSQLSLLNRGMLRHPVFADPTATRTFTKATATKKGIKTSSNTVRQWAWVNQKVPAEAFDEALKHIPESVALKFNAVVADIIKELEL